MAKISRAVLNQLREQFSGYYVLRDIDDYFNAEGFEPSNRDVNVTGQRRTLVEQYFANIDWESPDDTVRMLRIIEQVLDDRLQAPEGAHKDVNTKDYHKLVRALDRCGFQVQGSKIIIQNSTVAISSLIGAISGASVDFGIIMEHWTRMEKSVEDDPGQAIGSAKELVETTAKYILDELDIEYERDAKMPWLIKHALKGLDLSKDRIPDAAKGTEFLTRVFSGLGNALNGINELRGLYGTGHGRSRKSGAKPRHARLAVGAAMTLAVFLIETREARRSGEGGEKSGSPT